MEAIILAGGYGTRLRPLTYSRAKPLLPIMNKPMVSYIAEQLPPEVDKVILAVNYRKDQIEEYFKDHDFGLELIVNDEPEPLGTGGATKFAEEHITGSFFVLNSDIICSLKLQEMIEYHKKHKATATISLWPVENVSEFGVVDMGSEEGNVIGFVEKPKPEDAPSNLINAGAYILEPEVLDYIPPGKLVSMEKEIFPQIIDKTQSFYGYQFQGYWIDVGRITSYLDVHQKLLSSQHLENLLGNEVACNGKIQKSVIGNCASIGENSTLDGCIVLDHATIEDGCTLKNSVIGASATIKENSKLDYTVAGDSETVKGTHHNKLIWTQEIPKGYPKKQIGNVIGE